VSAGPEERSQPLRRKWNRVRTRDTDCVKALRAGESGKRRFERGLI